MLTERLALRRLTTADAAKLLSLDGDPQVMRLLTGTTRSLAQIRDEVLPPLARCHLRYPGFGYWAAETLADGEFIGWFGLRPVTPTGEAIEHWPDARGQTGVVSLGYRLRRSAWGHGYATEGARALVRRAFADLGAREVVATTMAVNTGSRRVMEKAGLRYARTVHLDWPDPLPGTEHGDVEYRLLRDEWQHLCATTALQAAPPPDAGIPGSAKSGRHHRPGLLLDLGQLRRAAERLGVKLVDVFGAGRPGREPAGFGDDLEPADRRAVARRLGQHCGDLLPREPVGGDLIRRQLGQRRLLLPGGRAVDARVGGFAVAGG
jgi:RimJ/RimL family protein N-acetyltransferase